MKRTIILLTCIVIYAFSHSGRTDAKGGHYNRKTGGYHYHNSGYSSSTRSTYTTSKPKITRKKSSYFLQSSLSILGYYYGTIDGMWGSGTTSALKKFQRAKGLSVTGTLNSETKNALLTNLKTVRIE